jgi:hypothetical protein
MDEQLVLAAPPPARRTDPSTSADAARRVAKGSDELERTIAEVVKWFHRPVIAEQIARVITGYSDRWTVPTIISAVTRARRRGLIVPAGTGQTSRGNSATAYKAAS